MANGGDARPMGGDRGPELVLLVDDEIRAQPLQHWCQVGRGPMGDHVDEHPSAHVNVWATVVTTRHLTVLRRRQHHRLRMVDREADVVHGEPERPSLDRNAPVVANATSWPAARAARARGIIG